MSEDDPNGEMERNSEEWTRVWCPGPNTPTTQQCTCSHDRIESELKMAREVEEPGTEGPIVGYEVTFNVRCVDCGVPFEFLNVPHAIGASVPHTGIMAVSLHVAARPWGVPLAPRTKPPLVLSVTHTGPDPKDRGH